MFLDDLLPSQNTLFEFACNALQAGSVQPSTPCNTSTIQNLEILNQSSSCNSQGGFLPGILTIFLISFPVVLIGAVPIAMLKLKSRQVKHVELRFIGFSALAFASSCMLHYYGFKTLFLWLLRFTIIIWFGIVSYFWYRLVESLPGIIVYILEPLFPNLKNREAGLFEFGLMGIGSFGSAVYAILHHQGYSSSLFLMFLLFFISFGLGSVFHDICRLDPQLLHSKVAIIIPIVSTILVFIAAHVFPQQIYHTCTVSSLYFTFMFVLYIGTFLAFFNFCVFNFHMILNSEKLHVSYSEKGKKYKGYVVKKGSEWVEVRTEEVFNI